MAEKFYITAAIPYVNSRPHLGHALELVQADVVARWARLAGREVYFLSGADEHGAKIVRAAEASGKPVQEFVDENSDEFRRLIKELGISTSDFIRTSDEKRHFPGVQALWRRLDEAGDIYKKSYRGLYCVGHEAFVTQKDLVNGKCADHGAEPEVIEEENYFFRLSKYGTQIQEAIESGGMKIYPEGRRNEILSFIKEGLEDVSFSRPSKDISWGIPVPGDASQTMYVWCDALSNYITALGFGGTNDSKFKKFWPADLQVIGKDILRFHAAIWPGMLLSAGLELPKALLVHGFIHSGGQKMSKTLGNVVDPFEIIERHGSDAVRYYLLREIPTFEDGDFTEERFLEAYNSDLANGLGNYVSRVAKMIENYFGGELSKPSDETLKEVPIAGSLFSDFVGKEIWPAYRREMGGFNFKFALDSVWRALKEFDGYVQTYEPFKLIKTDKEKTKAVLWNLASGALTIAWMIEPFMPDTSKKIFDIFGVAKEGGTEWGEVKVSLKEPLFPRKDQA